MMIYCFETYLRILFFYFVHSFYAEPVQSEVVSGVTNYGIEFCSALSFDNVNAVQFHPEKSGLIGLKIYDNFLKYFCGKGK